MKKWILFTAMIAGHAGLVLAQTNPIVFSQLLSCTNTVLMTNAEFRCTAGSRIAFYDGVNYGIFEAKNLNSNVLAQLGLTAEKLTQAQSELNKKNKLFWVQLQQQEAAIQLQKQQDLENQRKRQQAEQAALDRAMAQIRAESPPVIVIKQSPPPNPYNRMGFIIGN